MGSSSFITNLDGDVAQHIEYVPFGEVFIEERNNVWNTPYLFNAKEFDEETGLYYYGARYYDSRVSLWLNVDPLAEERSWQTPYHYCSNNPINRIDYKGLKDYIFNKDGTYSKKIENNNFWHNLFYGSRGVIKDDKGKTIKTFYFNNPSDIERFSKNKTDKEYLYKVKYDNDFNSIMNYYVNNNLNETKDLSIIEKYKYVYNQSLSGGNLDFAAVVDSRALQIIGNVAYDNFDAGNFLWGYTLRKLNILYDAVIIGSQYNGFWNGKLQNGLWNSSMPNYKRITWTGDSKEDQRAIKRGYYYPLNPPTK